VVNQAAVLERLAALQDYIDKLRPFQSLSEIELTVAENYATYWAVQRGLELAAQCIIDIATHLQAALHLGSPHEYREPFACSVQANSRSFPSNLPKN
jgi:uncharacterized protein YutE (UPF0331/DUF86 family)